MRKLFLFLSVFFVASTVYLLITPEKTYAEPPKPKNLWGASRCVDGEAIVSFYWDTSGYTINGNPVDYDDYNWEIEINGKGFESVSSMPHVYDASGDPVGTNYEWRIRNNEKSCGIGPFGINCNTTADGPTISRATCSGDPYDPLPPNPPPADAPYDEDCSDLNANDTPRFRISANKAQMQWNDYIRISPEWSSSVEQAYIDNSTVFVVQGFREPLKSTPTGIGVNLSPRNPTWNAVGGPEDRTFQVTDLIDTNSGNTIDYNPGEDYQVTFYLFREGGFSSGPFTAACRLSSNGATVTISGVEENPEPDPDSECTNNPDPLGQYVICANNQICDEETKRCIDDPDQRKECGVDTQDRDCYSGICDPETNKCVEGYAAFNCNYSGGEFTCKTALGKINTNPERFVQNILQILLGISGGILLVLIIFNGYKLMTSQGDPEKLKDAREGIIAAIAGILLVIFSITLLQFITVDILGIPGFG